MANALQLQQMLIGETRAAPESLRETYPAIVSATHAPMSSLQKRLF